MEKFTDEIYWKEYSIYAVSRDKRKHWEIIRTIYQYMRKQFQEKHLYYNKVLRIMLYYTEQPFNLVAEFEGEQVIIWSNNPVIQEKSRQLFKNWQRLEEYYADLLNYCEQKLGEIKLTAEQARIKEERRQKRLLNDPDNPAARKRKARRHLQRLGYDLHKSRKIAKTENDRGLYQIVKLDTGEIIAGKKFDLTLDQVEQFYMDADLEKYENQNYDEDFRGAMYNREPNLEKREKSAKQKLKEMGYRLHRTKDFSGIYRNKYYCIVISRKHMPNDGREEFSLEEVEQFILANS